MSGDHNGSAQSRTIVPIVPLNNHLSPQTITQKPSGQSGQLSYNQSMPNHILTATLLTLAAYVNFAGGTHADWPRFLNRDFDGTASNVSDSIDWTVQPKLAWSIEVGEGYGLGAIAGGRYYHFDATNDRNATDRNAAERLTAYDMATGKPVWSVAESLTYRDLFGYEAGPRGTPAIDGDQIFTFGVAGRLTCRDLADGKKVWSVDTNAKYGVVQNFFGVGASPLVIDDVVVVMVGGSPAADQSVAPMQLNRVSPNGTAIVAFDRKTGAPRWSGGDDLASYSSPRTITIDDATYVLVFTRDGLLLIDAKTGDQKWRLDYRASILESVNAMVPVVDGNRVFISECYQRGGVLLNVDAEKPTAIWSDENKRRDQSMRSHWATPILVDGNLYGCSGRNAPDSDLRCIDWLSGEVKWVDERRTRTQVTRAGDVLIVLEERGTIEIIRPTPEKLDVIATWKLGQPNGDRPAITFPCWAAPIVDGNQVLVRGDRTVLCLEVGTSPTSPQ